MTYSTGRGGAGNMQTSKTVTSENNDIGEGKLDKGSLQPPQGENLQQQTSNGSSDDKKVFYSTGRGGAGNIKSSSSIPSPKLVPQGSNTPQLTTNKVSTGRGGFGNMLKNDNPELTRKVQDVDGPNDRSKEDELHAVASNKSFSVGRGGFGNVVTQQNSGGVQGNNNEPVNLATISSHGNSVHDSKKKGFMTKIKDIFK